MADQTFSIEAGADIEKFRLIYDNGGSYEPTTAATNRPVGCTQESSVDSGDLVAMRLPAQRVKLTASGAITAGAQIVGAADGKIAALTAGAGKYVCGYALEAATADGHIIECFFDVEQIATV